MSTHEVQAAYVLPPISVAVIAASATSAEVDLTSRAEIAAQLKAGRFITLIADANVWFNLGDTASGTVSGTATSGATQGWYLPAGIPFRFAYNALHKYLRVIAGGATFVRVYVSSRGPTEVE